MSDRVFFDTNLLVYAFDADDAAKQRRAAAVVARHYHSEN